MSIQYYQISELGVGEERQLAVNEIHFAFATLIWVAISFW